jgi:hypothetical protein
MDGHKLATAFRHAAEHAPPNRQVLWAEGFCDGLRFAAEITDLAADDRLSPENIVEVLAAMSSKEAGGASRAGS